VRQDTVAKLDFPILEFDEDRAAIIEPAALVPQGRLPMRGVACFFQDVIERVCQSNGAKELHRLKAEHGTQPIYELTYLGVRLAVFHPGVGGPLAAGWLEEAIAMGVRTVAACGGAGSLTPDLTLGQVIVPSAAVRDEGTSYHYLPPSREVLVDPRSVACVKSVLRERKVPYVVGKTWTTDAIYRETRGRASRRRDEGCIAVDMEAASLLAVARFREVQLAYLLYAGDSLAGEEWDNRSWQQHSGREALFWLAAEVATRL
jgi:uridine phosphorylase